MSFIELEKLRAEMGLGVNAFLRCSGVSKSSYYRRKRQGEEKQNARPSLKGKLSAYAMRIPA